MKSGLKSPCLLPSVCIEPPLGALDTLLDLCHACDSGTQCPLMIIRIICIYTVYAALYAVIIISFSVPSLTFSFSFYSVHTLRALLLLPLRHVLRARSDRSAGFAVKGVFFQAFPMGSKQFLHAANAPWASHILNGGFKWCVFLPEILSSLQTTTTLFGFL